MDETKNRGTPQCYGLKSKGLILIITDETLRRMCESVNSVIK